MNKLVKFVRYNQFAPAIISIIVALTLVGCIMITIKWVNAATVQNKLITPRPGVECVVVTSTDSVAVGCWKIDVSQ